MDSLHGYAWETGNSKQVAYLTADGHIHELFVVEGGEWGDGHLIELG